MKQSNPVDFLIVGTAKAGTTSLFEILRRHPDIFIPQRKECRYFSNTTGNFKGPGSQYADNVSLSLEKYRSLFKRAKPHQLCGDISTEYLYYYRNAVPKILAETRAQIPIIIILRNPIDRAYSAYLHRVKNGQETLNFEDALVAENERLAANWPFHWAYAGGSLYAEPVKAYRSNFFRVLILLFEKDIVTSQAAGKILKFLNLEPHSGGIPDIHANLSGYPRNRLWHRMIMRIRRDELIVRKIINVIKRTPFYADVKGVRQKVLEVNLKKEDMAPQTRLMLKEKFQDDVALLAEQTKIPVQDFWTDFQ